MLLARPAFAIKTGTEISTRPEIVRARAIIARVWRSFGYTLTVTSGTDSTHSVRSLHYSGYAEDYRTRDISASALSSMVAQVRAQLGTDYDVILEADHLHVEYDPT